MKLPQTTLWDGRFRGPDDDGGDVHGRCPLAKYYVTLKPDERFALLVEAMARKDEADADRLEDTCPVVTYRGEEQGFRDRLRRCHLIALHTCLNLRAGLAQLQMAHAFREQCRSFAAVGPVAAAQAAFMCGRAYGRRDAGMTEDVDVPVREQLQTALAAGPALAEELDEVRLAAEDAVERVGEALLRSTAEVYASDLLAQWRGFTRFCRDTLGLEPQTVFAAFALEPQDPEKEVLACWPAAVADEEQVATWAAVWARSWARRFP